jgi:hypothetical protein
VALKGLNGFQAFLIDEFLAGKTLVFIKSEPWKEDENIAGAKVTVQITKDITSYNGKDINNFGEQLVVKVRGVDYTSFSNLKPLQTEVFITDVEKATLWGDYKNQLSIIAVVKPKEAQAK